MFSILFPIIILFLPLFSNLVSTRFLWNGITLLFILLSVTILIKIPSRVFYFSFPYTYIDTLSGSIIILTFIISALIIAASQKILITSLDPKKFLIFIFFLAFILIEAYITPNSIIFYIIFEGSLIPTLLLVLGWGYQPERLQAGNYLIMYTIRASLPLIFSILLLNKINAHLDFTLPFWSFLSSSPTLCALWWLITIIAFLVKTPLFLTHLWLPKAHVEAPVAGSIILAGVLLKLGGYGILRLASRFSNINLKVAPFIIRVSLVGACITSFICIRQTDLKSLIAYSSVRHIGLVTGGIIANTSWGWTGALLLIIAHGLCSSGLFAIANITYESTQTRSMLITKGLIRLFPIITFWWFILSASNIGAPPSLNLLGEIILIASITAFSFWSTPLLILARFLAAAYSLFLFSSTQHGSTPGFSSPLSIFIPRNFTISFIHSAPLFIFILNPEIITNWLWLHYSNCRLETVLPALEPNILV